MQETSHIYLTYNLFVAPACIAILGIVLKGYIKKLGDDASERYEGYKKTLENIQSCVTSIKVGMERKLDREKHEEDCEKNMNEVWDRVNKHSHTFDAGGQKVGKVIIE